MGLFFSISLVYCDFIWFLGYLIISLISCRYLIHFIIRKNILSILHNTYHLYTKYPTRHLLHLPRSFGRLYSLFSLPKVVDCLFVYQKVFRKLFDFYLMSLPKLQQDCRHNRNNTYQEEIRCKIHLLNKIHLPDKQ